MRYVHICDIEFINDKFPERPLFMRSLSIIYDKLEKVEFHLYTYILYVSKKIFEGVKYKWKILMYYNTLKRAT